MKTYALTVTCKSTRGIVAAISGYLAEQGCNIIDSSQFDDLETGLFFMRVSFISEDGVSRAALEEGLKPVAGKFGMKTALHDQAERMKVLLMVSRFGHCLNDLLYRTRSGLLDIDMVGVVSNHPDLRPLTQSYGVDYHHLPVTPDTKVRQEAEILALVEQYLAYIEGARSLRLEIAADYLVMAAWLAYLKSCLLLPKDPTIDPSPEELALRLQLRLQRLDAMREPVPG